MTRNDDLIQHRRELEIHRLLGLKRVATRNGEKIVGTPGCSELRASNQSQRNPNSRTLQATRRIGTSTAEVHLHVEMCEILQDCLRALTCELYSLSKPAWRGIQKQLVTPSPLESKNIVYSSGDSDMNDSADSGNILPEPLSEETQISLCSSGHKTVHVAARYESSSSITC